MASKTSKAVILAGGKGTRLHPFSFTIPKPLMPIGQDPILLHLMNRLKQNGINHFLLAIGYQSELIKAYFGNGEKFGVKIDYFQEDKPLGTAGPLALMRDHLDEDDYFFLVNGDIYTELNFRAMMDFAISGNHDLVVGYVEKVEKCPYGVLDIQNDLITKIIEKPERRYCISSGIYVLHKRALKLLPNNAFFTIPDLINARFAHSLSVGAFPIRDFWLGIEDVENLDQVMKRLNAMTTRVI
jgi:NDP-sugar pyrophosphorylase family protein